MNQVTTNIRLTCRVEFGLCAPVRPERALRRADLGCFIQQILRDEFATTGKAPGP